MQPQTAAMDFLLMQETSASTKGLRCVCSLSDGRVVTGGLDGGITIWSPVGLDGKNVDVSRPEGTQKPWRLSPENQWIPENSGFIYTVAPSRCDVSSSDEGAESQDSRELTFYVGTQEKWAARVTTSGKTLQTYKGHTGPVNSLVEFQNERGQWVLASGSWDGTMRLWDAPSGQTLRIVQAHKFAVTICLVESCLVTGTQDGHLRLWTSDGSLLRDVERAHDDIVRSIARLPSGDLVSVANDGRLQQWSMGLDLKNGVVAHDTLAFHVAAMTSRPGIVCTTSEDFSARIWDIDAPGCPKMLQRLQHPGTVWQVVETLTGDIVTVCGDGVLRAWTTDESRAMPPEERQCVADAVKKLMSEAAAKAADAIDVGNLPHVSETTRMRGSKVGQHCLFAEGDTAVAYTWNGTSWTRVGEVVGPSGASSSDGGGRSNVTTPGMTCLYEGDEKFEAGMYDVIFSVEIGEGPLKKLPYRVSENPITVAEKFCDREGISRMMVSQIQKFIIDNAPKVESMKPTLDENSSPVKSRAFRHFPQTSVVTNKNANHAALRKRLLEENSKLPSAASTAHGPRQLSSLEMELLDSVLGKVQNPLFLKQNFTGSEMELVFRGPMAEWPAAALLSVMDLRRLMALHPQNSDNHKRSDFGWQYMHDALKMVQQDPSSNLAVMALRYLSNLADYPTTRRALLKKRPQIIESLSQVAGTASGKTVRQAFALFLLNMAVILADSDGRGDETTSEARIELVMVIYEALEVEQDPEAYSRLLIALGTLCLQDWDTCQQTCKDAELVDLFSKLPAAVASDKKAMECVEDTKALLEKKL